MIQSDEDNCHASSSFLSPDMFASEENAPNAEGYNSDM